ncbi:MAG TPA: ferritin-like domain-containing protein [Gaiellaceae bacterium]|jgi:ferritin-like metal-binding protein YciE|nr:ferritin-like domain-containing protein [Gaiellaceae bacterium]
MQLNTLQDVLVDQVADLYSAETQLVSALPKMASAAHTPELREAFEEHLEETRGHVTRLDEALTEISAHPSAEVCEAMRGIIKEGEDVVQASGEPAALDAALIAAAQRAEHYEIAAYGTAKALAGELGYDRAASLFGQTLDEESAADKLLTKIAQGGLMSSGVNQAANAR